jgi:hypothetical protein
MYVNKEALCSLKLLKKSKGKRQKAKGKNEERYAACSFYFSSLSSFYLKPFLRTYLSKIKKEKFL